MTNSKSGNQEARPSAGGAQDRRAMLKWAMLSGGAAVASFFRTPTAQAAPTPKEQQAQAAVDRATRGMPAPRIKDVSVIQVGGGGGGVNDSTVVKVTTDQAGLYGYGCATATYPGGRAKLVAAAVEQYLKPLVMGRTTDRIEQIWQLCYMSSYYKNDTILNCAIGGVCDALWDIKGRQAGMPVYQLVGGKCRDAADIYLHVGLGSPNQDPGKQLVENSMKLVEKGCRYLLVAMFLRDGAVNNLYGQPKFDDGSVPFDRDKETRKILSAFETFRKEMPPEIGLGVDVHSLLDSIRAVQFCKHINALARHVGVELSIDDWQKHGHDVPLLVNMQPAGFYLGEEFHRAGGVPAVVRELMQHKRIHEDAMTVNGRTMGENCREAAKPEAT